MKKNIKSLLATLFLAMIVTACQEEDFVSETEIVDEYPTNDLSDDQIKLGDKLENPYSVENMKKAYKNINAKEAGLNVRTTHFYVKFEPDSDTELDFLKLDTTLILFDYPLDYELKSGGTYYRDPNVPKGQPTYQYASVSADYKFPSVKYEVLQELYIPEEDASNVSNGRTTSQEELTTRLLKEAFRITGNEDDIYPYNEGGTTNAKSVYATGRIRVLDNSRGANVFADLAGVEGIPLVYH